MGLGPDDEVRQSVKGTSILTHESRPVVSSPGVEGPTQSDTTAQRQPTLFSVEHDGSSENSLSDEVQVGRVDPRKIVYFSPSDPENPYNWSKGKKLYMFATGIITVFNSTLGSSLPSGAISFIAKHFDITDDIQLPLPISCFLAGYVVGPMLCGPLSENNGRKPVLLAFFLVSTIFTMASAVAPSWPTLLFFRFICGVGLSAPISIAGGLYADIYDDPRERGVAMAWFIVATSSGPVVAPVISGFIAENATWRWVFGFATLFSVATLPLIIFMPESFGPVLLSRRAKRLRRETGDPDIIAKAELQKKTFRHVVTVVMTRPYRMLFNEVIVMSCCAYCALAYGIFYLYFEAYPIIFQGPDSVYKWSWGISGLAFLPIGIGSFLAAPILLAWDSYLAKAQKRNAKWANQEEYRRLPLACLGGPLYVVSLFWIGWSAKPGMHWLAPVASGVPFGLGFVLIFMALLNYLSDSYMIFAASAQGIASTCRSVFGALLPLGAHRMFSSLGVPWACSLLAFLSLGMCLIPVAFIKYGDQIRDNSSFCKQLKAMQDQEAAERKDNEAESADVGEGEGQGQETIYEKV
ncbi:hypothetical protein A1O1_00220 [Capronia coronata CBS 617.96]|uniref:Major facilitator superfamily (MFS) profile domain-containing protein n=1 Tax=Capronia coronata CBS 617.96 TaxID=1182541 RepID=W9Z0K8_9EURO|nr:uncharacterized protein A1O1_00220 [Capronia coronata CBS 617.96]EXJ95101.1 hypothetical protein A1O1_00220 [Capronia coronata CBS 617.96]